METILKIKGMHCNSCKLLIEDVCMETEGVFSCSVDIKKGNAIISHIKTIDKNLLKEEIESLGDYEVEIQ